jgi:hypothetical protein
MNPSHEAEKFCVIRGESYQERMLMFLSPACSFGRFYPTSHGFVNAMCGICSNSPFRETRVVPYLLRSTRAQGGTANRLQRQGVRDLGGPVGIRSRARVGFVVADHPWGTDQVNVLLSISGRRPETSSACLPTAARPSSNIVAYASCWVTKTHQH